MIFEEKTIKLKNGSTAILKTPDISDAKMLLNSIKNSCGETDFLSKYSEDWDKTTIEDEEKWIKTNRESESNLIIACYFDGEFVGNCDISFLNSSKTFHRAVVGIAIRKKCWNLGIGSAMFEVLMKAAKEHKGTEIVELEYFEDNERGKALYKKFGFEPVCIKPKACKLKDGTYKNLVYMQKEIR